MRMPPPDRVLPRPVRLRERLVDEDDGKRVRRVGRGEGAAAQQPLSQRLERAVGDDLPVPLGVRARGRLRSPRCRRPQSPIEAASGSDRTIPRCLDAGQAADAFEQRPVERDDRLGLRVGRLRRPQLERQHVLRLEAEVDAHQGVETAQHQARRRAAGGRPAPSARRRAHRAQRPGGGGPTEEFGGAVAQRLDRFSRSVCTAGAKPKRNVVRIERAAAKSSMRGSMPIGESAGRPGRALRRDHAHAHPGEHEPEHRAGGRQHEALRQELPREARLARARWRRARRSRAAGPRRGRAGGWRRWRRPSAAGR